MATIGATPIPGAEAPGERSSPSVGPSSERPDDLLPAVCLERVLAGVSEGVLITDAAEDPAAIRILYVNDTVCRCSGYARDDMIGRSPLLLQGFRPSSEVDRMRAEVRAGREFRGRLPHVRRDGSTFVANWVISPIVAADGRLTHFVGVARDLSPDRRVAEVLRNTNDELEQRVAERTSALADLALRLQREIDQRTAAEEAVKLAYAELELRVKRRTRELSLANESLALEVRERRDIEQALRESEARWRVLVENAPAYILLIDQDRKIRFLNRARPGLNAEEMIGQTLYERVHPDTRELVRERLDACFATGEPTEFEATGEDPDGEIVWYHTRVAPIRSGDEISGLLFVSSDITDRRKAEEHARVRQAELAHVARIHTATELASGLAHEINQPLTAIASSAEAVLRFIRNRDRLDPGEMIQTIEHIAGQARRAADVVRHLRGFVRKAPPSRGSHDLNLLVADTVAFMRHEAQRSEVRIDIELAAELPPMTVDPVQIQQVLVNLIKNACEAMRDLPAKRRRIMIRTRRADDSHVEISVEDGGTGIDAHIADQIFNAFFTTKPTGLGLGLSISRSLVEDHGGRLWMTANADRGVTFHCRLPFLGASYDHARALRFLD